MDQTARLIKEGNQQAFSAFFHAHHFKVVRYLHKLLPDQHSAADIAQDVFVKVWERKHQIDPEKSLSGWLFTIVRNEAATHIRKILAEEKRLDTAGFIYINPITANEGERKLQDQDAQKQFAWQLTKIPAAALRCLLLHRDQGLTYRMIAEQEGVSLKTVEKRIGTALKLLRVMYPAKESLVIALFLSDGAQAIVGIVSI